jgi:hypothetical protein
MRWTFRQGVCALCLTTLTACGTASETSRPRETVPSGAKTLQTFPADGYAYELAIGACEKDVCPITVALMEGTQTVDRLGLPVSASTQQANEESVDLTWGADPGLRAWATGQDQAYVGVAARPVKLGSRGTGLLVTERYGFDHLKRQHLLLGRDGRKLAQLWAADEGSGPTWSATQVAPRSGEGQTVVFWQGFFAEPEGKPDSLRVQELSWDETSRTLRASPGPDETSPLFLTIAGQYSTVAQARKAKTASGDCLDAFWVLSTDSYPGLQPGRVIIAAPSATRVAADTLRETAARCLPAPRISIASFTRLR